MTKRNQVNLYDPHIHGFGDFINNITGNVKDGEYTTGLFKGMSTGLGTAIGAAGNLASSMAGGAIGGGMSSGAGNVIGDLGKIASVIPGPYGAIIGAGLNVAGGLVNRAFGSKMNQENINQVQNNIDQMNSFNSNAGSFDEFMQNAATQPTSMNFSNSFIGKDGWFSKKVKKKANALRKAQNEAAIRVQNSLDNNVNNLLEDQADSLEANYAAFGGPLHSYGTDWDTGIKIIGNGGTHEQNPMEGVPMGVAEDGAPNLVEEGEVLYNNYVFSNRIKVPKAVKQKYKLRKNKETTFADEAKSAQKDAEERPNDPISQRGLNNNMYRLMLEQEKIRQRKEARKQQREGQAIMAAYGGLLHKFDGENNSNQENTNQLTFDLNSPFYWGFDLNNNRFDLKQAPLLDTNKIGPLAMNTNGLLQTPKLQNPKKTESTESKKTTEKPKEAKYNPLTALRYVPALGAGIGVFSDLMGWTNKPDYSNVNAILEASRALNDVKTTPIGDYMRYTPLDRLFYANQLGAQAAGTRRNVLNTSGGNRSTAMAGLLSADYNAQRSLGDLYRKAEEYNLGQRERVSAFNRGTNQFNAEQSLKAQMANRDIAKSRIGILADAAKMRDAIDARVGAARSANLTNFFDSLGDIGREATMMSWVNNNPGLRYNINLGGKGVTYDVQNTGESKAKGGYLTIKNKRRKK